MGRAPCCEKVGLNKGSWTPAEDMRLVSYIQKFGHGNWRALPKQAGLLRCGKSCRLRWINYLRPDIKRGNFSKEEEDTIIKMHATIGNKWSKIASCLPGRTDNEIKNVWNTHLKKRVVASLNKPRKSASSSSLSSSSEQSEDKPNNTTPDSNNSDEAHVHLEVQKTSTEKIEIPVDPNLDALYVLEEEDMNLWKNSNTISKDILDFNLDEFFVSSRSSTSESYETSNERPDIPTESELMTHDNSEYLSTEAERKSWLTYIERELDLWGSCEENQQSVEMEDDPVSSYFQSGPAASPCPLDLFDFKSLGSNVIK